MAEPCMDTECVSEGTRVRIRIELAGQESVFSFCSAFCARESLDDVVGRALTGKGQVVMKHLQ